jgi:hypothetical protein
MLKKLTTTETVEAINPPPMPPAPGVVEELWSVNGGLPVNGPDERVARFHSSGWNIRWSAEHMSWAVARKGGGPERLLTGIAIVAIMRDA